MHCEWVRSDVDGCEWVRMGALGHRMHGGAWKQDRKRQNELVGHISVVMAGEISPDIMFWEDMQKMV